MQDRSQRELIEDDRSQAELEFPQLFAPQLELRGYTSHRAEQEQLDPKLYRQRRRWLLQASTPERAGLPEPTQPDTDSEEGQKDEYRK